MSVRLYVLLLLLCFGINAQAQQKTKILHITGAVKDTTGVFLDSAIIFTTKDTAISDTAGKFKINVTSGDSVFIAKKGYYTNGYVPQSEHATILMVAAPPAEVESDSLNIRGLVRDTSHLPIANALVYTFGDSTHTDSSGLFRINIKKGDTVFVSSDKHNSLYYVPRSDTSSLVLTPKRERKDITMVSPSDTTSKKSNFGEDNLEDVVVVGYGTQNRKDLTSAVATIKSKELINRPTTNLIGSLQGLSPGLIVNRSSGQPGKEGFTLQTRGYTSVNGGNLLGLVDGVNGDITTVNPYDIESVTVLKDASAAAIYGARAAGGVVLVTTKRGKRGFHVNYNTMIGIQKSVKRPDRVHSWQEAELANEASINTGQNQIYTDQQINWMKDPNTNYQISTTDPSNYDYYYDLNQIPLMVKNSAMASTHNLSFSGGTNKDNYYFSLGYYDQDGLFKVGENSTNRLNLRFNYNHALNDIFDITSKIAYRKTYTSSPSYGGDGIFDYLYSSPTRFPIYVPNTENYIFNQSANYAYPYLKDGGATGNKFEEITTMFQLRAKDFIPGVMFRAVYGGRYTIEGNEIVKRTVPLYNITKNVGFLNNPNSYEKDRNLTYSNNIQLLADYDKKIYKHTFHVLGGYAFENYSQNNTIAIARNLSSNDLFTLNIGDPSQATNSEDIQEWAMSSFFGRFEYNYDSKYLFQATVRADGNSRLDPNNRWKTFPSFSVGWRLAQESWFQKALPIFNEFKIRASWGRLGNSDGVNGVISNYDYFAMLVNGEYYPFNNNRTPSYYQQILPTLNKTWEIVDTKDIGIDVGMLKNRLTFTADYYVRNNDNMLMTPAYPAFMGITPSSSNKGKFQTKGWEFAIGWKDNIGQEFSYWVNANISNNTNKVIAYGGAKAVQAGQNYIIEGQPINTIWGFRAQGLFQTAAEVASSPLFRTTTGPGDIKYEDIDGNGSITVGNSRLGSSGDLVKLGDTYPHYIYGFSFGANYKGFDFSAMFQGVGKRVFMPSINDLYAYSSSSVMPLNYSLDYWTTSNPDARFPRMYLNGTQNTVSSSYWLMNGAYLRLKNVQLGYTLPSSWLSKYKVESLRIFFTGQDLWTKSNLWIKSLDPETAAGNPWRYPIMKNYSFGLNLNF